MCGLSFSGKTTLAKAISSAVDAEYIGLDDINAERGLRGGDGIPGEEWEKTSRIAVQRVGLMLSAGRDVVLDDTLCFRWLRNRYAEAARQHAAPFVLIYVSTPLSEIYKAMARNDVVGQRSPIRADVFEDHMSRFETPSADEQALVFSRDVPVQEWLARHLSNWPLIIQRSK
jgi:predicted kinase